MGAWPTALLGDLCEIRIGRTPARAQREYWNGEVPWLSIADMNQGRYLRATKEKVTDLAVSRVLGSPVPQGTVVLSFKLSIGKVGVTQVPMYTNEAIAALPILDPRRLVPEFLYWALGSLDLTHGADRAAMGNTLNKAKLLQISIPVPPVEQQQQVVEVLDRADELRAKRRESLDLLDGLCQSVFLEMFGDPWSNPMGWDESFNLRDVAEISSGITKGRNPGSVELRTVPYLAVANVQDKRLDLSAIKSIAASEGEISRYRIKRDDLLLTEGGDPDKLGRGSLWCEELPEVIHQNHIFKVRVVDRMRIEPVYLNWLVASVRGKRYFLQSAKQTTGIASINMSQLRQFPLLVPPLTLQRDFVRRLEGIDELKATCRASLVELDALFASLQDRAFRGEL